MNNMQIAERVAAGIFDNGIYLGGKRPTRIEYRWRPPGLEGRHNERPLGGLVESALADRIAAILDEIEAEEAGPK